MKKIKHFSGVGLGAVIGLVALVVLVGLFSVFKAVSSGQETGQVGVWTSYTKKFVKLSTETGINNYNPLNKVTYYDVKTTQ